MTLTHLERIWKAREIWNKRDLLIDLRLDYGERHGRDLTYLRMTEDIERLACEAEALERSVYGDAPFPVDGLTGRAIDTTAIVQQEKSL